MTTLDAIKEYKGTIYKTAEGSGWQIVNNAVDALIWSEKPKTEDIKSLFMSNTI